LKTLSSDADDGGNNNFNSTVSADGGQWRQHASPDDVRRRLLRVGRQLVDMSSLSVSRGEVEQR